MYGQDAVLSDILLRVRIMKSVHGGTWARIEVHNIFHLWIKHHLIDGVGHAKQPNPSTEPVSCYKPCWWCILVSYAISVVSEKLPVFNALVVLKPLVSRFVACSARIAADGHTYKLSTVTFTVHARRGLSIGKTTNSSVFVVLKPAWSPGMTQ